MRTDVRDVADGTYPVHGGSTTWVVLTEGARAVPSRDLFEGLDGELTLPGHGPPHRGSVRHAALQARERAL
ncbi:hypothetical protein SZN_19772 [Streptomyces zinciresistens K42]|uniref:Uncharacterized protein n=1 Tax=Streptomyces zinciresistens K42 TaxID=700597 RepID=G2GEM1_9ACTN|nr:hypothetical protein SZN_19772 [Streptomyces zinciresistens K42]